MYIYIPKFKTAVHGMLAYAATSAVYHVTKCLPTEHFVPARVLRTIQICWSLVHRVSNANAAVWVHPGKSVVLYELGLIHT